MCAARARAPRSLPPLPPLEIPADLVPVADALRRIIRDTVPGVEERIYAGARAAGYRDAHSGTFCGLFTSATAVRLEFWRGVRTTRPERILHDGRYVQFRAGERVPRAAVKRILDGALRATL